MKYGCVEKSTVVLLISLLLTVILHSH